MTLPPKSITRDQRDRGWAALGPPGESTPPDPGLRPAGVSEPAEPWASQQPFAWRVVARISVIPPLVCGARPPLPTAAWRPRGRYGRPGRWWRSRAAAPLAASAGAAELLACSCPSARCRRSCSTRCSWEYACRAAGAQHARA
eukprot:scaffold4368_cov348-Prasinococcus_capsulatus_cf.AAC.3